jgi:hypothetical protein
MGEFPWQIHRTRNPLLFSSFVRSVTADSPRRTRNLEIWIWRSWDILGGTGNPGVEPLKAELLEMQPTGWRHFLDRRDAKEREL